MLLYSLLVLCLIVAIAKFYGNPKTKKFLHLCKLWINSKVFDGAHMINRNVMRIIYYHHGHKHILHVPVNSMLKANASGKHVYIRTEDLKLHNVTQEPGVPYLCSASELGGLHYALDVGEQNLRILGPDRILDRKDFQ